MIDAAPPEGHDSAEGIALEAVSPEEILRLRRARAIAKRSVMMDLAGMCDRRADEIKKANPGRTRGSVSKIAKAEAAMAHEIGDLIMAEREKIEIPT